MSPIARWLRTDPSEQASPCTHWCSCTAEHAAPESTRYLPATQRFLDPPITQNENVPCLLQRSRATRGTRPANTWRLRPPCSSYRGSSPWESDSTWRSRTARRSPVALPRARFTKTLRKCVLPRSCKRLCPAWQAATRLALVGRWLSFMPAVVVGVAVSSPDHATGRDLPNLCGTLAREAPEAPRGAPALSRHRTPC